jgi:hypothetical protein
VLQTAKADKAAVQAAVDVLLALKTQFKTLTGSDFASATSAIATLAQDKNPSKNVKKSETKDAKQSTKEEKKSKATTSKAEFASVAPTPLPAADKLTLYLGENDIDNLKCVLVALVSKADIIITSSVKGNISFSLCRCLATS